MSIKQVKQSPSYPFLTKRAADVLVNSIDQMIKKLCSMEHVEYFEGDDGEHTTCKFSHDTEFRDSFILAIEDEIDLAMRKHKSP